MFLLKKKKKPWTRKATLSCRFRENFWRSTFTIRYTDPFDFDFFHRYVPVSTLKVSKLRARQIAEPKLKLKYPKKYSIKTEDASLTVLKNELPWTLHPLPPPLPTSKTIKLEVDKSMPWALHPLPPPMKTKNLSEYYWPDPKKPKYIFGSKHHPMKLYRFTNGGYKTQNGPKPSNGEFKPSPYYHVADKKPVAYKQPNGYKQFDHNKPSDEHKHEGGYNKHVEYNQVDFKSPDYKSPDYRSPDYKSPDYKSPDYKSQDYRSPDYKSQDYKSPDYKSPDYKSPDYKSPDYKSLDYKNEYPKHVDDDHSEEHDDHGSNYHHHHGQSSSYSHDDRSAKTNGSPPPTSSMPSSPSSSQPVSSEYVSHLTIEPSIQIAAFSATEMQSDGTTRDTVSRGKEAARPKCQCPMVNGHRHKRDVDTRIANGSYDGTTTTGTVPAESSMADRTSRSLYAPSNVGHATDIQIVRSHDITGQSVATDDGGGQANSTPVEYVERSTATTAEANRVESKRIDPFRDDSDKFKVDFGRTINNAWNGGGSGSSSVVASSNDGGRFSSSKSKSNDDRGGGGDGGGDPHHSSGNFAGGIDNFGGGGGNFGGSDVDRSNRKPGRVYHVTKSKVENKEGGVAFSVQTPFSVSSFSSNLRHPLTEEHPFRYTGGTRGTESPLLARSPFGSDDGYGSEPLDFEQFGLRSVLRTDDDGDDDDRRPGLSSGRQSGGYLSRDTFDEGSPSSGRWTSRFPGGNTDPFPDSRQKTSHFTRDFGDRRSKQPSFNFGTEKSPLNRFINTGNRFKGGKGHSSSSDDGPVLEYFQPVVIDFEGKSKGQDGDGFSKSSFSIDNGHGVGLNDKSRYFGKSEGFPKFRRNQKTDALRLPGRLHESNENLSRKALFHPSTFDID